MRIFLSAVSAQFKACRDALASDLRAIHCEVRVQEDFQQGPRTLIEQLEEYVAQCDRVIALIGDAYGGEASGVPAGAPSRSYTQWEYFFALGEQLSRPRAAPKDLYVYFASAQLLGAYPVEQGDEERRRQASFVEGIKQSGKHPGAFDSVDQLCRLVLRDGWQMENRPSLPAAESEPIELATLREALTANPDTIPDLDAASLQAILGHQPHTFSAYRVARVAEWSQPRYALDKRFTRLTLILDQGPDAQGTRWQAQSRSFQDLRDVLAGVREPAVVVLGPPGCGKSTLLRRLELDLAVDGLRAPSGQAPLSLFLPLNRYRPYRPGEAVPAPEEWLAQEWQRSYPGLPELPELLRTERLLLLLDAANEMPHADEADYRERIARWKGFLADLTRRAPGTRVVFSCRSLDYSAPLSTPDLPVPHVRIERLADEQVEEFLTVYSAELGPALWRQLRGTEQLDLFRSPFYLKLLLAQTERDGAPPRDRAALFTGFVRQALAREVELDNRLFHPGALLDARDRDRVARRDWRGPYDLPARSIVISSLCRLAFDLQAQRGTGDVSRVRAPYETALALLGGDRPQDLLRAGVALQVLEEERDDVLFAHQLLQEYFAARTVAATPRPELVRTVWRATEISPSLADVVRSLADSDPLPQAPVTGWEETFVLAISMAREPDAFVAALAELNLPLAGRCAAQPGLAISPPLRERLQQALVERSRDPAADPRARIAAARALGELGDPRFERRQGADSEYLLPPMVMIEGGDYPIGSDEGLYADEAPAHRVTLAPFAIGRFPVTNAEWRLFQESGGYEDERWWDTEASRAWRRGEGTAEGPRQDLRDWRRRHQADPGQLRDWQWEGRWTTQEVEIWQRYLRVSDPEFEAALEGWYPTGRQTQPSTWSDPAFNHAAQLVVGVCWYEARAYCAWLSAQTGQPYRLPTEAEWEAAARGRLGQGYAWGDEFDPARCNTFEAHVRGTTPPGVFRGGDTPEGLTDMPGNVWEWSSSHYQRYPYRSDDGREDAEAAEGRRVVVRGGSWGHFRDFARGAYRGYSRPVFRYGSIGFRVVRGSPIS